MRKVFEHPERAVWAMSTRRNGPMLFAQKPEAVMRGTAAYYDALRTAEYNGGVIVTPEGETPVDHNRVVLSGALLRTAEDIVSGFLTYSRGVYRRDGSRISGIAPELIYDGQLGREGEMTMDPNYRTMKVVKLKPETQERLSDLTPNTRILAAVPEQSELTAFVSGDSTIFYPHPAERPDKGPTDARLGFAHELQVMLLRRLEGAYHPSENILTESYVSSGRAIHSALIGAAKIW